MILDVKPSYNELLPHLFRQEYAKIIAVLCRHFSLEHIEIAEDIASDTFLKASEHWAMNGIPSNPTAWLYTVAQNKARDYFKHLNVFEAKVKDSIKTNKTESEKELNFSDQLITDSQLAMIFAVCDPNNSFEVQISLALQVLCSFSLEEISNAFLTNKETIKKRLHRGRINLRNNHFQIKELNENIIQRRLPTVLRTIYLLFNEGYFSRTDNELIRIELCSEAIRLALLLTENPLTNVAEAHALLSLMCFQSSRLVARKIYCGEAVLFEDQNRDLWDQSLIERGNYYLINATNEKVISKYHLEAGIAYWHTSSIHIDKWKHILQLYNQLLIIEYSPIAALNRAFAFSKVYGNIEAIREIEKLKLNGITFYHELLGYLHTSFDIDTAVEHYVKAVQQTKSEYVRKMLEKEIARLISKRNI